MANWLRIKIPILSGSFPPSLFSGLIFVLVFAAFGIHLVFSQLEAGQTKVITTAIGSLLRDESSISHSYLLAQSIEDMQTYGAIRCAKLSRIDGNNTSVFYNSTFFEDCPTDNLHTVILPGLDGNRWEFKMVPYVPTSFYITKWLSIMCTMMLLLIGYKMLVQFSERERQMRELAEAKRAFLQDLADQVAHDVASPMSALKVIAEKAPLDSGTRSFLKEAVSRTTNIFESLREHKSLDYLVDIPTEIAKIVEEKKISRNPFPQTRLEVPPLKIFIPGIEFSRVISNLLDNASEAGAKNIEIKFTTSTDGFSLVVSDDGCPIPQKVFERLGTKGNTFGKPKGSGLGLYQGCRFMQSIGGMLGISQSPKKEISLNFPKKLVLT